MQELSYPEIFQLKLQRQSSIQELEFHVQGAAPHCGKISPGCLGCFGGGDKRGMGIFMGRACQFNCPFCYYDFKQPDQTEEEMIAGAQETIDELRENTPQNVSFVSDGETLLYLDKLNIVAQELNRIEKEQGRSIHRHLYTNGMLATPDVLQYLVHMGVDEIRFHLSASNFHPTVLANMREAVNMGFRIAVEEPGWPPIRDQILSILPTLEDIGVAHVNIIEMWLTKENFQRVATAYPAGRYYKDFMYHLYDEGLVYDVMEEKIKNNYSFSVLDCNSMIEKYRSFQDDTDSITFFDAMSLNGLALPFASDKSNQHWWERAND